MAIDALLRQFLSDLRIEPCGIVVAASGGADSTALLVAMRELEDEGYSVTAAHVNHALRGAESDEDESFLQRLCGERRIPFRAFRGDLDPLLVRESGVEAAARHIRYELLESARVESGARFIATGHTGRDQAETLLMRFITGSGPSRLRGIAPIAGTVIRPLLEAGREDVESFLNERGIETRNDSSNDDPRFLRNRIRHEILPRLLAINPNLYATLGETAKQARSEQAVLDRVIREASSAWIVESDDSARFFLENLPADRWLVQAGLARQIRRLDPAWRSVSAADLTRLAAQLETLGRVSVTAALELVRWGSGVTLRKRDRPTVGPFEMAMEIEVPTDVPQIGKRMILRKAPGTAQAVGERFQLPEDVPGTFAVRNRRAGDRFHPTGGSRERSLSDIFIERRIPRELRDSIPILTWNGEIVSVIGLGVSEPFRPRGSGSGEEAYVIILEESK